MRITGYEVDGGKLSAVYITDETREIEQKKYVEERPHGEWIDVNGDGSIMKCLKCGEEVCCKDNNFCPNCGADMRGDMDG